MKLDGKKVLIATVATPAAIILHELVHMAGFVLVGIPAHLKTIYMATPLGFPYDVDGVQAALAQGQVPSVFGAIPALGAPVFTVLLSLFGVLLYRRWRREEILIAFLPSLLMRTVALISFFPKYWAGTIRTSDEAIGAYFLGVNNLFVWAILLLLSLSLVVSLVLSSRTKLELGVYTVLGGLLGFFVVGMALNFFLFHDLTF